MLCIFGLFNSAAGFCSTSQLDFRQLCSGGSFWRGSHRSICLSVKQFLMKRCHLGVRALKRERASHWGSCSDSTSTRGASQSLEGPTQRRGAVCFVGAHTSNIAHVALCGSPSAANLAYFIDVRRVNKCLFAGWVQTGLQWCGLV